MNKTDFEDESECEPGFNSSLKKFSEPSIYNNYYQMNFDEKFTSNILKFEAKIFSDLFISKLKNKRYKINLQYFSKFPFISFLSS